MRSTYSPPVYEHLLLPRPPRYGRTLQYASASGVEYTARTSQCGILGVLVKYECPFLSYISFRLVRTFPPSPGSPYIPPIGPGEQTCSSRIDFRDLLQLSNHLSKTSLVFPRGPLTSPSTLSFHTISPRNNRPVPARLLPKVSH